MLHGSALPCVFAVETDRHRLLFYNRKVGLVTLIVGHGQPIAQFPATARFAL